MNVLSLFDGMSCGQLALQKLGAPVSNYYASEVDKPAMQVTKANFPNTKHLGDVTKWREWDIDWGSIDLILAGSPCQGFSFAGKQLAFDDPRSKLFFVFVDILKNIQEFNPKVRFLLENVRMKKQHLDVVSEKLGVGPVSINSSLVSAQNRRRFYWANWVFPEPNDKNLSLQDIIGKTGEPLGEYKVNFTPSRRKMWDGKCKNITNEKKSSCLTTKMDRWSNAGLIAFGDFCRFLTPVECERLQTVPDNYTSGVPNAQRYRMLGNGWTVDVVKHILSHGGFKNETLGDLF
tara:strand:+ start:56 stop:925 length:870 start_codon:yes stop_codon:yes gene_type:complete